MLSTDRQTDRQTNATENITSFAKEVMNKYIIVGIGYLRNQLWTVSIKTTHNTLFKPFN